MLIGLTVIGAYCVLCYATLGRWLWKHPGPGGLGALAIPFVPLFPLMGVGMLAKGAVKRLSRVFGS